jgi:hypothetical protein
LKASITLLAIPALVSGTALAAYQLLAATPVNVSNTAAPTEKGRLVEIAYVDGGVFVKPTLVLYTDGTGTPGGQLNVYVRRSFDGGATWDGPTLLSQDSTGNPTGGQTINVGGTDYVTENDKASVFAPSIYSGSSARNILVTWTSSWCPDLSTGVYPNAAQKVDTALTPARPYKCVWTARSTDAGNSWTTEQLTDGSLDAENDVVAGSQNNNAFAVAWQADPMGLQPGEAEGPGDGSSGAHTTGGTNIWYTYTSTLTGGNPLLRSNIVQLSDNVAQPNPGGGPPLGPGASRPILQMSGSTAAIVYEETKGGGGKNIHFHSFAYNNPDVDSDGTIVNDPLKNARRPRVVLQGNSSAGSSPLRMLVLYRQSDITGPGVPADIMLQRGLKNPADATSTGYRAADLEPYTAAQDMSDPGGLHPDDNALAHRAFMRGSFIAFGYSHTPNEVAADPKQTSPPTQTHNFYVRTSHDSGATWSAAKRVSQFTLPSISVAEPRLVPTRGTLVNPVTGIPDPGDTQNTDVFYVAYGSYLNIPGTPDYRVFITRTTDGGLHYEPRRMLPGNVGQSESQLRVLPDGSAATVLWMQAMPPIGARDVMLTQAVATDVPQNSNCLVSTAVADSPYMQDLGSLRRFRDHYLKTGGLGRGLVRLYYRVSPPIAAELRRHEWLRLYVRAWLIPVLATVHAMDNH